MKSLSRKSRRLSARRGPASSYHCPQCRHSVGLSRRFVDPYPADAREAHRQPGLVPAARMDRIERDFQDQALLDLADRSEALDGVPADPAVEPAQFLVGEAEIG